jgi:hypothetical protein
MKFDLQYETTLLDVFLIAFRSLSAPLLNHSTIVDLAFISTSLQPRQLGPFAAHNAHNHGVVVEAPILAPTLALHKATVSLTKLWLKIHLRYSRWLQSW